MKLKERKIFFLFIKLKISEYSNNFNNIYDDIDEIAETILVLYKKWKENRLYTRPSWKEINIYCRKNLTRILAIVFNEVLF